MSEDRESIWSVPVKAKRVYYSLFVAQMLIGTAIVVREAVEEKAWTSEAARMIWTGMTSVAITSAAIALTIIETGGFIMVLGSWLKEKLDADRKKLLEEAERGVTSGAWRRRRRNRLLKSETHKATDGSSNTDRNRRARSPGFSLGLRVLFETSLYG